MATSDAELRLDTLPTELLNAVLLLLSSQDAASISLVSKRLNTAARDPLIWRHYYRTEWRFWADRHGVDKAVAGPIENVDWRAEFCKRKRKDKMIAYILDDLLSTQQARAAKMQTIVKFGGDAKDELLRQCACDDTCEDVLARSFYAETMITSIHKQVAIETWKKVRDGGYVPIEEALACFDLFVIGKNAGDLDDIKEELDSMAVRFTRQNSDLEEQTPRERIIALVAFIRALNFTGVPQKHYENIQNNFVGVALRNPLHHCLPLINAAIFCSIAQRIGIDAQPCGYPFHILVIVQAAVGMDLDGKMLKAASNGTDDARDKMYLDPWRSECEVHEHDLRQQLKTMGMSENLHDQHLRPASAAELVLRSSRNITRSVQLSQFTLPEDEEPFVPEANEAFYGAAWANVMLSVGLAGPTHDMTGHESNARSARRQILALFTGRFQPEYPWDGHLMRQYMLPHYRGAPEYPDLEDWLHSLELADDAPRKPVRRTELADQEVIYRVGQVFQHRRFQYEGLIIGWDIQCSAGEEWISRNGVDESLAKGRHQSFYHVLVGNDRTIRYVAQENIDATYGRPTAQMIGLAGRYFKRWDDMSHRFVSNIKDKYPED